MVCSGWPRVNCYGCLGGKTVSFKLKSVSIYSYDGEIRTVTFKLSGLNILTGRAATGKSSIIDIVDYCLGRSECYVAAGVIRQHVSWFAVELEKNGDCLFVGRRNPGPTTNTSPDIFVRRGTFGELPIYPDLQKNITEDALISLLTRYAGIEENENRPTSGTREPLRATLRHAIWYCFQKQDEIASRERLFHRQGDPWIPQAIKDTLPYFLGAFDSEYFLRQEELDDARTQLRALEAKLELSKQARNIGMEKIRRYVTDGKRVGLIDQNFESSKLEDVFAQLKTAAQANLTSPLILASPDGAIEQLENEQKTLLMKLQENVQNTRATRHFLSEQVSFATEATEQGARLATLELFPKADSEKSVCPICLQDLDKIVPAVEHIRLSLQRIETHLVSVSTENPHLQSRLDELGNQKGSLESDLIEIQQELENAYIANAKSQALRDQAIERARVIGRISAFLDQNAEVEDGSELARQIQSAKLRVKALSERLNVEDVGQRIDTFLNLISDKMTDYAKRLELEHAGGRIRFDLKKLTVVADTSQGPIPLNRMGSGENWVGFHVLTHLALHAWFRSAARPVPGFLIFDQPSQVYYPPETDQNGRLDGLQDEDRKAVRRLFELMNDVSNEIGLNFQMLVIDHAHLDDDWFEAAIVEEWRGANALVPEAWKDTSSTSL
jgi:Protein of unknown function (DUF3732)